MWEDMGITEDLDDADRVYAAWARQRLRNGTLHAWVAEAGGEVVGGGALWLQPVQPRPGWPEGVTPYLLSMYTAPEWRGRGVARAIVQAAQQWCRKGGYPRMALHASDMGKPLYEAMGFTPTREMKFQFRSEPVVRGAQRKGQARTKASRAAKPRRAPRSA
jgi:GNAT superfamily N-acetyltransferase